MLGLLVNGLPPALLAFTIFFYAVDLHDVAQALDAAEHRDRRRRRRVSADDRLGGGDRLARARADRAVPHHLLLDAAAFLGAGALPRRRLRPRRRADAAGGGGRRERAPQILLYTLILAPLGVAPWALGFAGPLYGATAAVTGAIMVALAWQVFCERRPAERASKQLFAFSILYLFLLFAVLLVERGWGGLLARLTA